MLQMAVSGSLNEKLEINGDNLRTNIENGLGNNDFEFTDNGDGSYKVKINSSNRLYYIEENGNIITQENMIEIGTAEELKTFRDEVNSGNTYDGYYISLTSDITLDINESWEPIGLYLNYNSSPSDETNLPFSGVFDGNGHEVNGIYINTTDKVQGLFGLVNNGKIMNLGVGENCNITGGAGTAGIVGCLYNECCIVNCYNKSNITSSGNITAGIAGQVTNGNIILCYNTGTINTSGNYIGGICGTVAENSTIEKCYNTGSINSSGHYIGGISGTVQAKAQLKDCYNSGSISSTDNYIGGVCGENYPETILQNCYNTGDINGITYVGGISGATGSQINNCYNTGNIIGINFVGGISGNSYKNSNNISKIYNSYSLESTCEEICGYVAINVIIENSSIKSLNEMKSLYTILGISFKEDFNNINNGYPILAWQ